MVQKVPKWRKPQKTSYRFFADFIPVFLGEKSSKIVIFAIFLAINRRISGRIYFLIRRVPYLIVLEKK